MSDYTWTEISVTFEASPPVVSDERSRFVRRAMGGYRWCYSARTRAFRRRIGTWPWRSNGAAKQTAELLELVAARSRQRER